LSYGCGNVQTHALTAGFAVRRDATHKQDRGMKKRIETNLEAGIFASRWLLAPFYAGLSLSLALLLITFVREFVEFVPEALHSSPSYVIVTVLSLVDIVMVANLVLIIVFAGYEIFVSKINTSDHEDRPDWMGLVSFSDLKIKLMGTIVAISGIELLKTFVNIKAHDQSEIYLRIGLHLTFVVSGLLFAIMDKISTGHEAGDAPHREKHGAPEAAAPVSYKPAE
jgi:uncharacterized protein (TIGR00645 family)